MTTPLPPRQARLADTRFWAGYRQAHYARQTDTLVVVVEAVPAGLDPGDGDTKWYTICDDHNRLIGHSTLELAKSHASDPEGWCEVCNGNDTPDEP
jgi:hypothetical protein